jgi:hypothetical protein
LAISPWLDLLLRLRVDDHSRLVGRSFAGTFQAVAALAMRIFSRLRARKPLLLVVAGNR